MSETTSQANHLDAPEREGRTIRVRASDLKPWTKADSERLAAATAGPIDTSDSPPITDEDIATGRVRIIPNRPRRGGAQAVERVEVTLPLDQDLAAWLEAESGGGGYADQVNEALRSYRERVEASRAAA